MIHIFVKLNLPQTLTLVFWGAQKAIQNQHSQSAKYLYLIYWNEIQERYFNYQLMYFKSD